MKVIKRKTFNRCFKSTHMGLFIFVDISGTLIYLQMIYIGIGEEGKIKK